MSIPIERETTPTNTAAGSPSASSTHAPSQRPTTAIVPAAGWGTRLRPLTDAIPKEMLPVGRKLALEHIVSELHAAGIRRIVLVLSAAKEPLIRRYFGEGRDGVEFVYARQPEMRGLGDAISCARPYCDDSADQSITIALGDAVYEEATPGAISCRLADSFAAHDNAAVGVVVQKLPRERISRYGVVKPVLAGGTSPFAISDIVEKPSPEEAPSEYAVAARFVVRPSIFAELERTLPGKGGEIHLTDALRAPLLAGATGVAVPLLAGEARHDIGALDSYFRAFTAFAINDEELGSGLRGYVEQRWGIGASFEKVNIKETGS